MYNSEINFSLWCDFIERSFLENDFQKIIENGVVNGATSNPAIFKQAILESKVYKDEIKKLSSLSAKEIYEDIACEDIRRAAALLDGLYQKGDDGYISIEIDPRLCDDVKGSIEEGKRLYEKIGKKNVMIKVPATKAGYEITEELIADGINVNITLIFAPKQAKLSLEAIRKAHQRLKKEVEFPQVVLSVFVSRFDRKLDALLSEKNIKTSLTGIYNASKIYNMVKSQNIINTRTLFASTGVKGGGLEPDYYIKELLCPNAVNTAPLKTIEAFLNEDDISSKSTMSNALIDEYFKTLENQGIDMEKVYDELMSEGLEAFKIAFNEILEGIDRQKI
jgi:transaldolase